MEEEKPTPDSVWINAFIGDIAYGGWIKPLGRNLVKINTEILDADTLASVKQKILEEFRKKNV